MAAKKFSVDPDVRFNVAVCPDADYLYTQFFYG